MTIKGETHNFPSSIAPFGGVATKHGGVIRDSIGFGQGGFPSAAARSWARWTRACRPGEVPAGALHPGYIVRESIRATAYYCNPMGIPMMYSALPRPPGLPQVPGARPFPRADPAALRAEGRCRSPATSSC